MARESTITILRSTGTDIPTGLTFGELAYSDLNGKLFVGKNDGSSLWVGAGITAGSIATNSDYLVPTQSAVKAYVDGVVGGGSVVNTFNGSGGAITLTGDSGAISNLQSTTSNKITARLASASVTGVASFNSAYLTVSNGAVSLASAYQVTGDTVAAGTGISVSKSGNTSTVTNSGVLSFNSATGAVNYSPAIASSSVTGVASFNSTYFAVGGNGAVTLASAYQATGQTVVSGGSSQIVNTSGNTVTIDNRIASASVTGVASFNSTYLTVSNGAVSLASAYQVTGDTVAAGASITVSRSGNTSTITSTAVPSFNGGTGAAITLTGDTINGVITVDEGNKYSWQVNTRKATTSLLGVASFSSSNFSVNAGVVTLSKAIPDSIFASTSVTGVASFRSTFFDVGATGVVTLASAYQVTGDTIAAGTGIAVSRSGNTSTVTNIGVQSFNGATGAVGYSPAIASSSVTGVASFNSTNFTIGASGHVTLASSYQATGQTVVSGGSSQLVSTSGNTVTIDNRVASASVTGVASFNSTYLTVSNGAVSLASAYQVTGDTVAAGTGITVSKSGNTSTVTNSGVLSFNSATGAVNYSPAIASASVTGVASFNSTYFAVGATGHVTLASSYQATGQTVVSGGSSQIVNTSGNTVTIDNRVASASVTGVASFNSTYLTVSNGAVSLASAYQVTGDTVAAGTGISVSKSGNTSTVTNSGVLSFNSATGAVNYSPVIATTSVTGVASFNSTHFTVSGAGAVSSAGITVKVSSGDAGSTLNSGGTLTITGTANEINIQRTASTYTIGLPTDVTIGGNLTVNGTVVTANVASFVVEDPLIMLGTGNAADSVDLGFYSQYTTAGRLFSGFFRDASDSGKYKLFTGLTGTAEPTTTVNVAGSGYTVATLVAKIDGGSF